MFSTSLFSAIPANKFYPPRIASGQTMRRTRLIDHSVPGRGQYQFMFIEAQAGQGKTTTAIQLVEASGRPFMWYQVGEEDGDPILFLAALLAGIQQTFPHFSSPVAETQLEGGQALIPELVQVLNAILHDLDQYLEGDCTLVFDDVHLLEQAPQSLILLDHLLDSAPPSIAVLVLSRRPVMIKSKRVRFGGATLYLYNEDLALSRDEGMDLLALFLDDGVEAKTRVQMIDQSGGWPMGLVLTAQNYLRGGQASVHETLATESYFEDELLASLSAEEQVMVLKLALLDEISVDLAELICPDLEVGDFLHGLSLSNFFLRLLDDDGLVFGFHHHFLAFLRKRGENDLSQQERVRIWNIAADAYVARGMIGRGMSHYLKSLNIEALEELFYIYGHGMVARNRHITLNSILSALPDEILHRSGLLTYFAGLILQISDPSRALRLLKQSRELFCEGGETWGELLAACGILYLYVIHSDQLPRAEAVFPAEVAKLHDHAATRLPEFSQVSIANHLALGFLFFGTDFGKAKFYNDLAQGVALKMGLVNLQIESRIAGGWIHVLSGDYKAGGHIVELNYPLICQKEVGLSCRLQLYMLQLDHLHQLSEYANFDQQKNEYFARVGHDVLKQSFVYPFLVLWEVELLFSQGRLAEAVHLIDSHILTDKFSRLGNFRGEMLGWRALCAVCHAKESDIEADVAEVLVWLEAGASPLHTIKAMLLLGNMYRLTGQYDLSLESLNRGVDLAQQFNLERLLGCALLHRASLLFGSTEDQGRDDLARGLHLFKEKLGCRHILGLTPAMLTSLLQRGVEDDIHPLFCKRYGLRHLHLALGGGEPVPLLRIQVLGGFQVSLPEREQVGLTTTFIKGQRRLLGLLLRSETHEVVQSVVQQELWPDVPEDKARGRFDTLMARLRKELKPIVHPHGVKQYLVVSKGVVALRHCRVDSYEFCRLVSQGLLHLKNGEFWQAGNCFYSALSLYKGEVALELLDLAEGGRFAEEPKSYLLEMALQWCPVLAEINRHDEAMRVSALAWQYNHENGRVARLLYGLYVQSGFTSKARKTLDEFSEALATQGVDPENRQRLREEIEAVFP